MCTVWTMTDIARRGFSGLRKVEALFLLGTILFIFAIIQVNVRGGVLRGLMATNNNYVILSSLANFTLRHDDESRRREYSAATHDRSLIYLTGDGNQWHQSDWNRLTKRWHSKSTYTDLLNTSQKIETLPSTTGRIIFILHNHPKMASTTLRRACWENLRSTCDVTSPKRDPLGYANTKELESILNKCKVTNHFCVMGWHYDSGMFLNITSASPSQSITFIHLFPFRNFDEWATSAMKQVFVGHSEAGCKAAAQRLEKCHGWLELDFDKYSKQALAKMLDVNKQAIVQQRSRTSHNFILYDFGEVRATLAQLSRLYSVPMMPYLDMQYKQTRREGSCSDETLKKFHGCFDKEL